MTGDRPPPIGERLVDEAHPAGSAEEVAAAHLRSAAYRRPPGPVALARVQARLAASTAEPISSRRLRWKTILALVALSAGVGGATGAAIWVALPSLKRARIEPLSAPAAPAGSRPRARRGRSRRGPPAEPPATGIDALAETTAPPAAPAEAAEPESGPEPVFGPEPMPAPAPVAVAAAPPPEHPDHASDRARVVRRLARAGTAGAQAAAAPSSPGTLPEPAIAGEARLLGRALMSLRRDHDPGAALAALDAHAARFPDSALGPEADITRVDALLALDRRQPALALLDRLSIPANTRGRELAVVRAELRVGAKRYVEAIADFTRALASAGAGTGAGMGAAIGTGEGADALAERALHGRAACYLATGNQAGARADLRDYLARFPQGRFAAGVRRTLGAIDGRP